jgi:hypothetical protein
VPRIASSFTLPELFGISVPGAKPCFRVVYSPETHLNRLENL